MLSCTLNLFKKTKQTTKKHHSLKMNYQNINRRLRLVMKYFTALASYTAWTISDKDNKLNELFLAVKRPTPLCSPSDSSWASLWAGRAERGSDRENARSGRVGGRAGLQHRPGQEAARMEIRPDRFKAVAGKTLGKIHRYTHISDIILTSLLNCPTMFTRLLWIVLLFRCTKVHPAADSYPPPSNQ